MKTMTCADLGGLCDATIEGETPEDMMKKSLLHMEKAHPDITEDIEDMTDDDMRRWNEDFMKKWSAAPDT